MLQARFAREDDAVELPSFDGVLAATPAVDADPQDATGCCGACSVENAEGSMSCEVCDARMPHVLCLTCVFERPMTTKQCWHCGSALSSPAALTGTSSAAADQSSKGGENRSKCRCCGQEFASRNALFKHLESDLTCKTLRQHSEKVAT